MQHYTSIILLSLLVLLINAAFGAPIPDYLEINEKDHFKIIAITDLHANEQDSYDRQSMEDVATIIEIYNPDLLALTGDLTSDQGLSETSWVIDHIAALGVPWIFARGNHDNPFDFTESHNYLSNAPNSLHAATSEDPNYRLSIRNKGETEDIWNIYVIDDGSYSPKMGFKEEQVNWFNAEVERVGDNPPPAFLFIHIPLPEYQDVWDLGNCVGVKGEPVYYEEASPNAFKSLVDSKQILGVWCGHDHVNSYHGEFQGIMLTYVRPMCYRPTDEIYGDLKNGCELITVDVTNKTFTTKPVFADDPVMNISNINITKRNSKITFNKNLLTVTNANQGTHTLRFFNAQGKVVLSKKADLSIGYNEILINTEKLSSGLYIIEVTGATGTLNMNYIKE